MLSTHEDGTAAGPSRVKPIHVGRGYVCVFVKDSLANGIARGRIIGYGTGCRISNASLLLAEALQHT